MHHSINCTNRRNIDILYNNHMLGFTNANNNIVGYCMLPLMSRIVCISQSGVSIRHKVMLMLLLQQLISIHLMTDIAAYVLLMEGSLYISRLEI